MVKNSRDIAFHEAFDMTPEEEVIEPSSPTKFRKIGLKDVKLLEMFMVKR